MLNNKVGKFKKLHQSINEVFNRVKKLRESYATGQTNEHFLLNVGHHFVIYYVSQ